MNQAEFISIARSELNKGILQDSIYRNLWARAAELGFSEPQFKQLLAQLALEIQQSKDYQIKSEETRRLIPGTIAKGHHIKLVTIDEMGTSNEELIALGDAWFLLIRHERGSLGQFDLLKAVSSPWEIRGSADFQVFRNGLQVIHKAKGDLYQTKKIHSISTSWQEAI